MCRPEWIGLARRVVVIAAGEPDRAAESHRRALDLFRGSGDLAGQTWALNGLGEAVHATGQPADALAHHSAALAIATDIGDRDQQARAHFRLGHCHRGLGVLTRARTHYERALALYTQFGGASDADEVRAHLDELANQA